jgi:hypothetical protein
MRFSSFFLPLVLVNSAICDRTNRPPLTYAPLPANVYEPPKNISVTTLLDFVKSRSDLTILASALEECGGLRPYDLLESLSRHSNTAYRLSSSI